MAKFKDIEHPSFPSWFCESLDGAFEHEPRLKSVYFDLGGHTAYNDETYTETNGGAFFHYEGNVTADEEDFNPYIRRLDRRAKELWDCVPIEYNDSDGTFSVDENNFWADRKTIYFSQTDEYETNRTFICEAKFIEGKWECNDKIVFPYYDGSLTSLLISSPEEIFHSYGEETGLNLDKKPVILSMTSDDDENIIFTLPPGEIMRTKR